VNVILLLLFHVESLQLPDTLLLSSAHLWITLLNNYNVWKGVLVTIVKVFKLLDCHLIEVVAEHSVVEVYEFTKVGVHYEGAVCYTEL
jgi:hypothetical protein